MATPAKSIRFPRALEAAIEASAKASGQSFSEAVIDVCAEKFLGLDAEPPKPVKAAPKPKRPPVAKVAPEAKPAAAREALAQAEARVGVRTKLDTSSVPFMGGGKRPAYQKGQAGRGKR